tara:strand:- start:3708 stop:4028 length:321 start_codon:yes stop_codon:yes gene_type:complete
MRDILLFLIAWILFIPLSIINFFLVWDKNYFFSSALSIDKFANRELRTLWNKTLRTENGYEFGKLDETISSALGKNQRDNTLTKAGILLCLILDKLDKNHCKNSIT